MDSFAQVFDGAPRACTDPRAEGKAEEATNEIRRLCRIEGAGIVPTVEAWIWAIAVPCAPGELRPILVEVGTAGAPDADTGERATKVIVFASDGPWDGTLCAVAFDGGHTLPLLWRRPDGSMTPSSAREGLPSSGLPAGRCRSLPPPRGSRSNTFCVLSEVATGNRGEGQAGNGSWAGAAGIAHYDASPDGEWPADYPPSAGFGVPDNGRVAQWVSEAVARDMTEWRRGAFYRGMRGSDGEASRRFTIGIIWVENGYPLQADDVNRLRLNGAWMISECGETPDVVVVGHAGSYAWARVGEEGGARLRSSFPEIGRPAPGRPGEWILAPHIAADTCRQAV